jgi:hypothetical protein
LTLGGQGYTVYQNGNEIIVSLDGSGGTGTFAQQASGTVNILGVLTWVQAHVSGHSNMTLSAIDFGWEICSTGGSNEQFTLSKYILTGTPQAHSRRRK